MVLLSSTFLSLELLGVLADSHIWLYKMPLRPSLSMRWAGFNYLRRFATAAERPRIPQTIIEKVVQKYAVGLPDGKVVKAGDYVMIRPEHVMTHDNTGPVISK